MVAVTKEHLQVPGYKLVHSIRGDGGQSDSICPLKAFSVGATYFPFTVSSSSSRLGQLRGRAGGRKQGRAAAGTAWRGRRLRPHLARPPRTTRRDPAGRGPTRFQRVPAGADAEAPQLTTSSAARGGGGGGGSRRPSAPCGWRAARGRRQLTGGTAPQQRQPPPPTEPEPEPERPRPEERLPGATAAAEAGSPTPLHLQRSGRLWRGAGKTRSLPDRGPFPAAVVSGNFTESVSLVLCLPPPRRGCAAAAERMRRGSRESPAATGSD